MKIDPNCDVKCTPFLQESLQLQLILVSFFPQIQNAVKAGFVYGQNKDILLVADDCETLLTKLQERAANKEKTH